MGVTKLITIFFILNWPITLEVTNYIYFFALHSFIILYIIFIGRLYKEWKGDRERKSKEINSDKIQKCQYFLR